MDNIQKIHTIVRKFLREQGFVERDKEWYLKGVSSEVKVSLVINKETYYKGEFKSEKVRDVSFFDFVGENTHDTLMVSEMAIWISNKLQFGQDH